MQCACHGSPLRVEMAKKKNREWPNEWLRLSFPIRQKEVANYSWYFTPVPSAKEQQRVKRQIPGIAISHRNQNTYTQTLADRARPCQACRPVLFLHRQVLSVTWLFQHSRLDCELCCERVAQPRESRGSLPRGPVMLPAPQHILRLRVKYLGVWPDSKDSRLTDR